MLNYRGTFNTVIARYDQCAESVRFEPKNISCRPCRWNDESANADCNTAIEDGELSERARRTKRLKNSFLSGSKMASVDDAIDITASVSLIKFYKLV